MVLRQDNSLSNFVKCMVKFCPFWFLPCWDCCHWDQFFSNNFLKIPCDLLTFLWKESTYQVLLSRAPVIASFLCAHISTKNNFPDQISQLWILSRSFDSFFESFSCRFDDFSGTFVDLRHKDYPRLLSWVLLFFVAPSPPDMMVYLFVYLFIVSLPTGLWASWGQGFCLTCSWLYSQHPEQWALKTWNEWRNEVWFG